MDEEIQQPTTFSNVPHEFVFKGSTSSVFFVLATPNESYRNQALNHLKENGVTGQKANDAVRKMNLSTGFVISETDTCYQILTTAHVFDQYYSGEVKLNVNQINNWFEVSVLCPHYERNMAATLPQLYSDPKVDLRRYSPATVVRFDSSKDLMLLRVPKNYLYCDNNRTVCRERHRPIPCSRTRIPTPPSDVIMLAWPPCRPHTPLVGRIFSTSRGYGQITQNLSKGYDMSLYELDITGDDGCSGAPILNQNGHLQCVYHGRLNSVGYGISATDVRTFCGI